MKLKIAERFGALLSAGAADTRASVAITVALTLLPLILMIGAGIDYSRAIKERSALQAGTDAAVLQGIIDIRGGKTIADATADMAATLAANDQTRAAQIVSSALSSDGTTLCIASTSTTATAFMSIARIMKVDVGANACAKLNLDTFEIAVAIDNSGSMANSARNGQTKMQAAIVAANQLVAAMNPAGQTYNYAAFAIVPFASTVNIGAANAASSFMDTQGASSIHWQNYLRPSGATVPASRFAMFKSMNVTWGGCRGTAGALYRQRHARVGEQARHTLRSLSLSR